MTTTHVKPLEGKCFGYHLNIHGNNVVYTGDMATLEPFKPLLTSGSFLYNEAAYYKSEVHLYGRALRTHKNVKPVFISIGNIVSLDTACDLALKLTDNESHIPIPTRLADLETHIAREAERGPQENHKAE